MIFERDHQGAFVMSHYINNQIQWFISKNLRKTLKKQNTFEIFEKIARKYYRQQHKSGPIF